jgi:hypothetical protein
MYNSVKDRKSNNSFAREKKYISPSKKGLNNSYMRSNRSNREIDISNQFNNDEVKSEIQQLSKILEEQKATILSLQENANKNKNEQMIN